MIRITKPRISGSPVSDARVCVQADVLCNDSSFPAKTTFWFDVPDTYAPDLSMSGNPWLALIIPLAVNLHEPLELEAPVDTTLLSNVRELMAIWGCWYPHLHPVSIEVELLPATHIGEGSLNAALFSSGVDAWFSLLRHVDGSAFPRVDDLLTVWGLDIPLDNLHGCKDLENAQRTAADHFGLNAILISTNLAETGWFTAADWGMLAHGCALASVGHILEKRYRNLLIPSSYRYTDLHPWGSHPMTDALLSTSSMRMIHDGAAFSRVQKTEFIARSEIAMNMLQVCWETKSFKNCGACEKCCRTATTLMLLGALDHCKTLDATAAAPEMMIKFFPREEGGCIFNREIRELAIQKGNRKVMQAVDRSLRRYRFYIVGKEMRRKMGKVRFIRALGKVRLIRRIADWMA
jgi:hypothetical protein